MTHRFHPLTVLAFLSTLCGTLSALAPSAFSKTCGPVGAQPVLKRLLSVTPWADLQAGSQLELQFDLRPQDWKGLGLKKDARLRVLSITPLSPVPAVAFETQVLKCSPDWTSRRAPLSLVSHPLVQDETGVELEPGCKITWYVENRQLYQLSFFRTLSAGSRRGSTRGE